MASEAETQPAAAAPESDDFVFDFDPAALKAKYLAERDKRLRSDYQGQYITIGEGKGAKYSHWLDDPWAAKIKRDPMDIDVKVLVLGAGFSGILTGMQLKENGVTDFRIIDKSTGYGGTWYWNRYPGAACDSEAYCYLPLLDETGYMPTHKYVEAWEIRDHVKRLADKWDLEPHAIWQTECSSLTWNDEDGYWTVKTDRGDTIRAQFVVCAGGPINCPHLPDVEGIETFKGHEFHTARWDWEYTGGASDGKYEMKNLHDKRVAIIGTGATAIQAIPYLAKWAKELYVFQRTPSAVDVRDNHPTDPTWFASLPKGWQRTRDDAFQIGALGPLSPIQPTMELDDGFSRSIRATWSLVKKQLQTGEGKQYSIPELVQLADFRHMERIRKRVDEIVKDKETAELLKPWYNLFCKRPVYSDTYLQVFNQDSVHLIDTVPTKGITGITEDGIKVGDKEYKVDVIIWGTGFSVGAGVYKDTFKLSGRNGITRDVKFKRDGINTLFGLVTSEFPNLWYYGHAQGAVSVNFPSIYYYYSEWTGWCIGELIKRGVKVAEVTKEAEEAWADECVKVALDRSNFQSECTPGYYNAEGNQEVLATFKRGAPYTPGAVAYHRKLLEHMKRADFAEFKLQA